MQYTDKNGLNSLNVTAICKDPSRKRYYVGTGEGLYIFSPQSTPMFQKVTQVKAIEKINISSLSLNSKDELWVGAQEGVFTLSGLGSSFQLKRQYSEIAGQKITSPSKIIHDSNGNAWIATFGSGLFFVHDKVEKCYDTKRKFASDKILTVFEDSKSNIWVGTQDAGVIKYNGKTFEQIPDKQNLTGKAVWSVAEDKNGNMFFGTGESGLCRFDGKAITVYTSKEGLISDYLPAMQWDTFENCLWLGGEKGLEKINFSANHSIKKIHHYGQEDAFNSSSVNQNGIWMDDSGLLWLGTVNGLWIFNRHLDFARTSPPKIQLSGIRLFYQETDWKALADSINRQTKLPVNLILPYNKNHLTFDIRALTTAEVLYTFKLEGQDEQWSIPAKNNEITYSNIKPGQNYTFKAKALNKQGIPSVEIISFPFTISPPWWSTWLFRVVLFLAAVAALTAFIKGRDKMLRQDNLKLEKTVIQRTIEIEDQKRLVEERNERILIQKEIVEKALAEKDVLLKEIHHRVKNNLQTISSMLMLQSAALTDEKAKKAIAESQSRVRSIALVHQKLYQTDGLEKVELNGFIEDLTEQVKYLYSGHSKKLTVRLDIPETYILIDTAIPLGLIFNELLTNSLKYAFNDIQNGEIEIKLAGIDHEDDNPGNFAPTTRKVKLTYRDNGPGLSSPQVLNNATTLGLRLIKLLSQQIAAAMDYSNTNGSEFMFTFKIRI